MKLFTICALALLTTVGCGPAPAPVVDAGKPVPVVKVEPIVVTPEVPDLGLVVPSAAPTAAVSQPAVGTTPPTVLPAVEAPSSPVSK